MDAGIGSFGSSGVTPPAPVLAPAERPAPPKPIAQSPAPASQAALGSERKVQIDPETQSLIYSTIDVASGVVVRQTPDEARLKLRAYLDGVAADQAKPPLVERVA